MTDRPPPAGAKRATVAMLARARRILAGDIRPEDYLPVPAEVSEGVAELLAPFGKGKVSRKYTQRLLNDWTLSYHHGGQDLLCKPTEQGVIVLALGEQIRAFLAEVPDRDAFPGVIGTVPYPWQALALPFWPRLS